MTQSVVYFHGGSSGTLASVDYSIDLEDKQRTIDVSQQCELQAGPEISIVSPVSFLPSAVVPDASSHDVVLEVAAPEDDGVSSHSAEDASQVSLPATTVNSTPGSRSNSIGDSESVRVQLPRAPSIHAVSTKRVHGLILQEGNLAVILPNYAVIFNDFDTRPIAEAELSKDFLKELLSRVGRLSSTSSSAHASQAVPVQLLIPEGARDAKTEECIAERVTAHLVQRHATLVRGRRAGLCYALLWLCLGVSVMFLSSLVASTGNDGLGWQLLTVTMDPAGWFLAWLSLDRLYDMWRARPRLLRAEQMSRTRICFGEFSVIDAHN